jgi:S1-C subfamily serine protease
MNRKNITFIVIGAVVLSLAAQLLFGSYLSARLSALPIMRRYNLFTPSAPIVINNTETVRVSDTGDALDALNRAKSRLATVFYSEGNNLIPTGNAINWTADGYFITAQSAFSALGKSYSVMLNGGQRYAIQQVWDDPASDLVMFKVSATNLPVVVLANSKNLQSGQKIIFASNSLRNFYARFAESHITQQQLDVPNQIFDANLPSRTFGAQNPGAIVPGEAIVTLDGDVAGLWDGKQVVPADRINNLANAFFGGNGKVLRPQYGFFYRMISSSESEALSLPQGALVTPRDATAPAIVPAGPAAKAGLQPGDVITQAGDSRVDENTILEEILERAKPGDQIRLTVVRNRNQITLTITPTELPL